MNLGFLELDYFFELSFDRVQAFYLLLLPLIFYLLSLLIQSLKKNLSNNYLDNQLKNNKSQSLLIPKISQLGALSHYQFKKENQKSNFLSWLFAILAWIFMVISLANPVEISEPVNISRQARDLMIAIDLSESMIANDFKLENQVVDRLSATKWVVESFIEQRKGDRIGLILFADTAFSQSPLTFDLKTIQTFLDEAQVGLVGKKTAVGDAIALAARKYSGLDSIDRNLNNPFNNEFNIQINTGEGNNKAEKILILLTDGANNAGVFTPIEAAGLAKEVGLKIYPISIGPDSVSQGIGFFRRSISRSEYADEKTLKKIAETTGGQHFFAGNTDELREVYQLINDLEPVEQDSQIFRYQTSQFHYPLILSLVCLLVLIYRRNILAI